MCCASRGCGRRSVPEPQHRASRYLVFLTREPPRSCPAGSRAGGSRRLGTTCSSRRGTSLRVPLVRRGRGGFGQRDQPRQPAGLGAAGAARAPAQDQAVGCAQPSRRRRCSRSTSSSASRSRKPQPRSPPQEAQLVGIQRAPNQEEKARQEDRGRGGRQQGKKRHINRRGETQSPRRSRKKLPARPATNSAASTRVPWHLLGVLRRPVELGAQASSVSKDGRSRGRCSWPSFAYVSALMRGRS